MDKKLSNLSEKEIDYTYTEEEYKKVEQLIKEGKYDSFDNFLDKAIKKLIQEETSITIDIYKCDGCISREHCSLYYLMKANNAKVLHCTGQG